MLRIYHSNDLTLLKELVARLIQAEPLADPLAAETILVQSPGMAQWMKIQLAESLGIAANIEFPLPSSFTWKAFAKVLPDVPEESAFSKEQMTWKLMGLLPQCLPQAEFAALSDYLDEDDGQRKLFQLSGKVADVFDQYLVYRPQWMRDWEAGHEDPQLVAEHPWQPILWRALVQKTRELGQSAWHRANLLEAFVERVSRGDISEGLPKRLFVVGISALPPTFVEVLRALGKRIDIHLMVTNPCRYYWGDVQDPKYLARLDNRWFAKPGAESARLQQDSNPLIASWGKLGRDYLYLLQEMDNQDIDAFVEIDADSLLHAVQQDILNLEDGARLPNDLLALQTSHHKRVVAEQDRSLVIHSCHSALREVEVLHDQLLALFDSDTDLSVRDVVVMMPDVNSYSPAIQAVFGNAPQERYIPYAISDRSTTREDPLLASFLKLLRLPLSRFTVSEVLDLLEVPAIRARYSLQQGEFDLLRQWILESGIRWGIDGQSKEAFDLPALDANTWRFGIQRMLLGYALEDSTLFANTLPYSEVQGMEAVALGKLGAFIDTLAALREQLREPRPVEAWSSLVNDLLERCYRVDLEGEATLKRIRECLDGLQQQLSKAGSLMTLTPEVVGDYFQNSLEEQGAGHQFLAGRVNFCTLMPMRSIPFRVVCLLGMNDGSYPRSIAPLGFDLMALDVQRGDRSRREDDRYLFLEALLSAKERLYISYQGRSIRDNSARVPSVLVTELLEYVEQSFALPAHASLDVDASAERLRAHLLTEHPLQPFSADYFTGRHPELFSYAPTWLPAAARRAPDASAFIESPLAPIEQPESLELDELPRFLRNPCRYFFNRRLKVYLPQHEVISLDDEPFVLDGLEAYALKQEILSLLLQGEQPDRHLLEASGRLPQGAYGPLLLEDLAAQLEPLAAEIATLLEDPRDDLEVNLLLDQQRLVGWLKGCYGAGLVRYRPASLKAKDRLWLWIEHLAANAEGSTPLQTHGFFLDRWVRFSPVGADQARRLLARLQQLYWQGLSSPLPFLPETAYAWWSGGGESDDSGKALRDAAKAFAGGSYGPIAEADDYVVRVFEDFSQLDGTQFRALAEELYSPLAGVMEEGRYGR